MNYGLGWIALAAFFICASLGYDAQKAQRASEPYSMGVAITCGIGGPAFCPPVQRSKTNESR